MEIKIKDLSESPQEVTIKSTTERNKVILRVDDVDYPIQSGVLTDAVSLCARSPDAPPPEEEE